jgi:hypothetical protein
MAIDRVARQKNQEQDDLIDDLDDAVSEVRSRVAKVEAQDEVDNGRIQGLQTGVGDLLQAVTDLDGRVRRLEGPPDPLPPADPDPTPDVIWTTVRTLGKPEDWRVKLIEAFAGASITAVGGDTRFWLPGPQKGSGGRVELQDYHGKEGQLCAYEYSFVIPSRTRLQTDAFKSSPKNIISQHHGDKDAGYTGGVSVYPDGGISLRIKGGSEISMSGSHPYAYENELFFGEFERDTRHTVRLEILWARKYGEARARLDSGRWAELSGVPTWPIGEADGVPTTQIMYRQGWYPQGGIVEGDLEIFFGPLKLQVAS